MTSRAGAALVLGIGKYLHAGRVEPLRFAARDAGALARALADPALCAFPAESVALLTGPRARRDQVVQRLSRWLPEQARGAELAVIYFAGHGVVQTVGQREEGFLLPYDADPDDVITRGVAMSDIARWIDAIQAGAVIVCLDCCHAGNLLQHRGPAAGRNLELRPAVLERMAGRGRFLIASCDAGQKSFESAELKHGLFTYHLLRGIAGAADRDGDGRVGIAELFNYVSQAVARDARAKFGCEQRPWTSATWTEETYISRPQARPSPRPPSSLERLWREQGIAAVLRQAEGPLASGDKEELRRLLRFLRQTGDSACAPLVFRCLAHPAEAVREQARKAIHALGWDKVSAAAEDLARCGDAPAVAAVLDGLAAFETHPRVVALLDRLVLLLKGELRTRAILLLERKRLGLELDRVAALFRDLRSPYRLERVLGQGLFAAAYLARAETADLQAVVRVLRPEFVGQPQVRAAFLDLSTRALPLVHENLVLTRETRALPEHGIYYAVRDYVHGVTLQKVLEFGKRFEPVAILRILRQLLAALGAVHRRGMAHGGVKPSNIFLCEEDRVILGDPSLPVQGIGVALERLSYDYRYAAPEMFRGGDAVGPVSDLYALGCVAYELACGQPPFVSDNYLDLATRHLHESIERPSQRGSQLGPAGDEVLLKLLARSATDRYGRVEDVLKALDRLEASWQPPAPATGAAAGPLLHDASLARFRSAESLVGFDVSAASLLPPPQDTVTGEAAPPAPTPERPDRIGDYEILEVLGRGGMGVVYKARDRRLQRVVALKVLPSGLGAGSEQVARFQREAQAAARLQHPHIVQIFDIGEHEGVAFLSLEYVQGGSLTDKVRTEGPQPPRVAAELVAKLARAIHAAHEQGVLHRDLKPSNILLTPDGQPKIADFGLAKIQAAADQDPALTSSGVVLGTPRYMPPEQAAGRVAEVGPPADIYGLGTVLYELLTCRPPFQSHSVADTLLQLMTRPAAPPSTFNPAVDRALDAICLRCLEREPADRYSTASSLAEDLERWLAGQPITARAGKAGWWRALSGLLHFRRRG
jgi:serine/threonine-protein kinase